MRIREATEYAVDLRLAELAAEIESQTAARRPKPWTLDELRVFARAAYGKGYVDALRDGPERDMREAFPMLARPELLLP